MGSKVFVVDGDGGLKPLELAPFLEERRLDQYIEKYPDLLASALSGTAEPLRFVLVETQAGIDDAANETVGRWAADALFLDQHGVLTIVENKLAANPEIRRKIVGQMIEYVANLLSTFTRDGLRERLRATHLDVDIAIAGLLQLSGDDETTKNALGVFWNSVEHNLQAGMIRMVFVADQIPPELRHVIEFLNRYLKPMEVLGVSVDCMRDPAIADGREVLVTSTIGEIARKQVQRPTSASPGTGKPLTKEEFLHLCLSSADDSAVAKVCKHLVERLAACPAIEFRCHSTPGGDSRCKVVRKQGDELLMEFTVWSTNELKFTIGKVERLRPTIVRRAGYDLSTEGHIREWCAESDGNEQRFAQWIIDAATR